MTLGATPSRLTIEVATASVGLRMAPRARPVGKSIPGITRDMTQPIAKEVTITRRTASPLIAAKSRRNSVIGMETAAE